MKVGDRTLLELTGEHGGLVLLDRVSITAVRRLGLVGYTPDRTYTMVQYQVGSLAMGRSGSINVRETPEEIKALLVQSEPAGEIGEGEVDG